MSWTGRGRLKRSLRQSAAGLKSAGGRRNAEGRKKK
jgi:hypothetical protein